MYGSPNSKKQDGRLSFERTKAVSPLNYRFNISESLPRFQLAKSFCKFYGVATEISLFKYKKSPVDV